MRSLVIMPVYHNRRGGPLVNVIAGFRSLKILPCKGLWESLADGVIVKTFLTACVFLSFN